MATYILFSDWEVIKLYYLSNLSDKIYNVGFSDGYMESRSNKMIK